MSCKKPIKWLSIAAITLMMLSPLLTQLVHAAPTEKYVYTQQWSNPDPYFIDVDNVGNVYVAGRNSNNIDKYDLNGGHLKTWGGAGTDNGKFNDPEGIAVDGAHNRIYITDSNNNRVQIFDLDGNFVGKFTGVDYNQLNGPAGVAFDSTGARGIAGDVYVTDRENDRVEIFSASGAYISQFGGGGSGNGFFNSPESIAVDSAGNINVGDEENNRIQKFSSTGSFISIIASYGSQLGATIDPEDVAVDHQDNVYIADSDNSRIEKFTPTGQLAAAWGILGPGNGQFNDPRGVAIDSSGNVYVADTGNARIQKFALDTGMARIRVKDSSGNPVEGVQVSTTSTPTTQDALSDNTDATGYVAFKGITPGAYKFKATKPGYIDLTSDTITYTVNTDTEVTLTLVAESPFNSALKVSVTDSNGNPITGVYIDSNSQPNGQPSLGKNTPANGTAYFGRILPGEYAIQASKAGYLSATSTINVVARSTGESTLILQMQSPTTSEIRIRVRDSNGNPVEGASVQSTQTPNG